MGAEAAANALDNSWLPVIEGLLSKPQKAPMPSFMESHDQAAAEERMIGMYEEISQALQEQGATPGEINLILTNPHLQDVIKKANGVEEARSENSGLTYTKEGKLEITIREGRRDPLDKCLGILSKGATYLSDFAEDYPKLTSFSITALQLALAGPTKFVRDQAVAATGFYDKVEDITSQAKGWCSQQLQDKLGVNETYADVYAEAGAFGVSFGVGIAAGGSKEKILDGAKNVREKLRSYTKSSGTSVGQSNQVTTVLKGANQNRQGVRVKEAANSNQESNAVWMKKTGTDGGGSFGNTTGNISTTTSFSGSNVSGKPTGGNKGDKIKLEAKGNSSAPIKVPGRVQSRINIRKGDGTNDNPGIVSAWRKHGDPTKATTKSQFTISQGEVRSILQDKKTVQAPVINITPSGNYVREVNVGRVVGNSPSSKAEGQATSFVTILTDKEGNLVNVYPGNYKY